MSPNKEKESDPLAAIARTYPTGPLFVLVHGPEKVGKTHLACTFPPPVHLIDTEGRGRIVLAKFPSDTHHLHSASNLDETRTALAEIHQANTGGTIIVDSATDLYDFVVVAHKDRLGKDPAKPVGLPIQWAPIQNEMRDLIRKIRRLGRFHLVLTERVKAEYEGEKATGKFPPRGFRELPHWVDLHLSLWPDETCRVESNGFVPRAASPAALIDITYNGIRREILDRAYAQ